MECTISGTTALTNLGRLSSRRWQSFPTALDGTGLTCGQHIESHSCVCVCLCVCVCVCVYVYIYIWITLRFKEIVAQLKTEKPLNSLP
jgi:hypothetical protein